MRPSLVFDHHQGPRVYHVSFAPSQPTKRASLPALPLLRIVLCIQPYLGDHLGVCGEKRGAQAVSGGSILKYSSEKVVCRRVG